jgi:hypothetical protein
LEGQQKRIGKEELECRLIGTVANCNAYSWWPILWGVFMTCKQWASLSRQRIVRVIRRNSINSYNGKISFLEVSKMHNCYNYTGFSDKEVVVPMAENRQIHCKLYTFHINKWTIGTKK